MDPAGNITVVPETATEKGMALVSGLTGPIQGRRTGVIPSWVSAAWFRMDPARNIIVVPETAAEKGMALVSELRFRSGAQNRGHPILCLGQPGSEWTRQVRLVPETAADKGNGASF
jgi:hypothetical protein